MNILDDLKLQFKQGNVLIKLILINAAIFVAISLFNLFEYLFNINLGSLAIINFLSVPSSTLKLLEVPWTLITYNFLHVDFFHILFNLLWFYWFGQLFIHFIGSKKLVNVYILGGIAGGLLFIVSYNFFSVFRPVVSEATAMGASASIMAVVIATSFYRPEHSINLLFFGAVKLKYIAFFTILIDLLSIPKGNAGGHIAHLGGALFGYIYIANYKNGRDISLWMTRVFDFFKKLFKRKPKMKVTHQRPVDDLTYNATKLNKQKEIDRILDKIAKGGYESLTKNEKDFLFKTSKE